MVPVYKGDEDSDYDSSCGDDFNDDYHDVVGVMVLVYKGDEDGDGDYDNSCVDDFDDEYHDVVGVMAPVYNGVQACCWLSLQPVCSRSTGSSSSRATVGGRQAGCWL